MKKVKLFRSRIESIDVVLRFNDVVVALDWQESSLYTFLVQRTLQALLYNFHPDKDC